MKKILFLLTTLIFLGCQNQDSAGFANYDGRFDSYDADAKYVLGSDEDAQLAVNLVLAYADKDTDYMVEKMADSVTFLPPQGGESMVMRRNQVADVIMQLHSPYDSIKRTVWNAVPLQTQGTDFTRVTVAFSEQRFFKDGSQENLRIIDRIFISDGKIYRIHQWDAELP